MPTGIWQLVPVGQVSPFLQRRPQWSGGGLPVEENSHVGMAVAPVAAGQVPPVHCGRHMQPPNGNLAATAQRGSAGQRRAGASVEEGDGAEEPAPERKSSCAGAEEQATKSAGAGEEREDEASVLTVAGGAASLARVVVVGAGGAGEQQGEYTLHDAVTTNGGKK